MSLYQEILATGGYISSHESDLYIEVNATNRAILERYPTYKQNARQFVNEVTGSLCWDIPFAYEPWWSARVKS